MTSGPGPRTFHRRFGQHGTRRRDSRVVVLPGGVGKQRERIEAELGEHHHGHQRGPAEQQSRLDDLHPGRSDHSPKEDIDHHDDADHDDRQWIAHPEHELDELARAYHLRDEVKSDYRYRAERGGDAHGFLPEAIGDHVGEGVLADGPQAFRNQKQHQRPPDQKARRIHQAVEAALGHQPGDAQEAGRAHEVTRQREAVLPGRDPAARHEKVAGGARAARRPVSDAQAGGDEHEKEDDRRRADLAKPMPGRFSRDGGRREEGGGQRGEQEKHKSLFAGG